MSDDGMPVEDRARQIGWVPQEEWKGDPAKWRDADTFVQRGEEILPILRENNRRLEGELASLKGQLSQTAMSLEEMRKFQAEEVKRQVADARERLKAELKEAKVNGDVDAELAVQERLEALKAQPSITQHIPAPTPTPDPDLMTWMQDNKWFGTDLRKTNLVMGIAQELRQDPENSNLTGPAFYKKVDAELKAYLNPAPAAKVDSTSRGAGGGGQAGGKGWSNLPADAKEACDARTTKMVGEGRPFKTKEEWRTHYANVYLAGEE